MARDRGRARLDKTSGWERPPRWATITLLVSVIALVALAVIYVLRPDPELGSAQAATPSVPPADSSADDTRPRALFFGDSVMFGSGRENSRTRAGDVARDDLGWVADIRGYPGTGYVQTYEQRRAFPVTVSRIVPGETYDVVVIEGSSNDYHAEPTDEQLATAIREVIDTVRQYQPQAFIVLIGPYASSNYLYDQETRVLAQVAAEEGVPFIDSIERGWMRGMTEYFSPDGYHPNDAGQVYLGHEWANALKEVLPPELIGQPNTTSAAAGSSTPSS